MLLFLSQLVQKNCYARWGQISYSSGREYYRYYLAPLAWFSLMWFSLMWLPLKMMLNLYRNFLLFKMRKIDIKRFPLMGFPVLNVFSSNLIHSLDKIITTFPSEFCKNSWNHHLCTGKNPGKIWWNIKKKSVIKYWNFSCLFRIKTNYRILS